MHRRLPPLNSLRAFEVVSRHQSFRAAAEELHVTAAAVSQQVKTLENHLGRKLLRRSSGGYSLTADARTHRASKAVVGILALRQDTGAIRVAVFIEMISECER